MTTLIVVDGLKGGPGKSTVATALVDYRAAKGHVLIVDADKVSPDVSQQFENSKLPVTVMQADLSYNAGWEDFMGAIEDYVEEVDTIIVSLPAGEVVTSKGLTIDLHQDIKSMLTDLNIKVVQYFVVNRSKLSIQQFLSSGEEGFGSIADERVVVLNGYHGPREKYKRWNTFFSTEEGAKYAKNAIFFPELDDDLMDILTDQNHEKSFEEIANNEQMRMLSRSRIKTWISGYLDAFSSVDSDTAPKGVSKANKNSKTATCGDGR
jgi:hypothetical protein